MVSRRPSHGRSKASVFSFKSNRSSESDASSSKGKIPKLGAKDLKNVPKDSRTSKFGQSIKNPNRAIEELDPGQRAQAETSTLSSIRALQHKDHLGNVITDADASNPTRTRLERPLDTIRSFEAAIDENYKRRSVVPRTGVHHLALPHSKSNRSPSWLAESADATNYQSRPSSYAGGGYNDPQRGFTGYNGQRMSSTRPGENHPPPSRSNPYRGPTAPATAHPLHEYDGYLAHSYHDSHDTVNTGESSGSQSEPWTNSTDPSSENSSVDRIQSAANNNKMEYDAYGGQYSRGSPRPQPIQEEYSHDGRLYAQQQRYPQPPPPQGYTVPSAAPYGQRGLGSRGPPPPPPPQHSQQPRQPIKLGVSGVSDGPKPAAPPSNVPKLQKTPSDGGKRRSWLKRRFSKG